MVAVTIDYEVSTSIPPKRMFKAFIIDGNVIPSVFPTGVKNIEILQGDGGPGTVVKVSFGEGSALKSSTDRYDAVDMDNLTYTFTTIDAEGGALKNVIESVSNVVRVIPSADGSLCKITSIYNIKGDAQMTEEQLKGKDRVTFMCKSIEEYLITNPDIYN